MWHYYTVLFSVQHDVFQYIKCLYVAQIFQILEQCQLIDWRWVKTLQSPWRPASLQWCDNEHDGISNHQPLDCLLNHLFRHRSKETSKLSMSLAFVWGIHHWPVTWKMFPFHDIMSSLKSRGQIQPKESQGQKSTINIINLGPCYRRKLSLKKVYCATRIGHIYLTVPDHQQRQCSLQSLTCVFLNFPGCYDF